MARADDADQVICSMRHVQALPIRSLNHVSLVCSDVKASCAFYTDVLGFIQVRRPSSFDFDGCWLVRHGIGLHLIKGKPVHRAAVIEPKSDHFSFQSDGIDDVIEILSRMQIPFVRQVLNEGGIVVKQVFFHDPDHNTIEICNCDCLPMVEISDENLPSADAPNHRQEKR